MKKIKIFAIYTLSLSLLLLVGCGTKINNEEIKEEVKNDLREELKEEIKEEIKVEQIEEEKLKEEQKPDYEIDFDTIDQGGVGTTIVGLLRNNTEEVLVEYKVAFNFYKGDEIVRTIEKEGEGNLQPKTSDSSFFIFVDDLPASSYDEVKAELIK